MMTYQEILDRCDAFDTHCILRYRWPGQVHSRKGVLRVFDTTDAVVVVASCDNARLDECVSEKLLISNDYQ